MRRWATGEWRSVLVWMMTHPWRAIEGGITAPAGFQAAGITAGLKASGRSDLALVGTSWSGLRGQLHHQPRSRSLR